MEHVDLTSKFSGRRPVKTKVRRLPSQLFRFLGAHARVDVVAQQVLDHDDGIFKAVKENDAVATARLIADNVHCLLLRDSVGAAPIHLAFLFGHYELGKLIVTMARPFAAIVYAHLDPGTAKPLPYAGENVLHIAIVHRQAALVQWLLKRVPELLDAEATGSFFGPRKACYFGGTPLLFALASNQVGVALDILAAAAAAAAVSEGQTSSAAGPKLNECDDDARTSPLREATTIFMCDRFGNNALHLAVLHDLPNVYNFALQYAMEQLAPDATTTAATSVSSSTADAELSTNTNSAESLPAVATHGSDTSTSAQLQVSESSTSIESRHARLLVRFGATAASTDSETAPAIGAVDSLVNFMKHVDDGAHDTMQQFVMQRNSDELTPLSLAAAIGNQRMLQHILQQATSVAWTYGPITALHVPLLDLEQPVPRPDPDFGTLRVVLAALPSLLAPKGSRGYRTAIQCLCSLEPLSNTLSTRPAAMQRIVTARLEMLRLTEVKLVLHKKWKYVGRRQFMTRFTSYIVFLVLLNTATLFKQSVYQTGTLSQSIALGAVEGACFAIAFTKVTNELNQLLVNRTSYLSEAGAGKLDNVCTLMAGAGLFLSAVMRIVGCEDLEDAFAAVALIFAWLYLFFFLLGFRSTGPFVLMILTMIATDMVRFLLIYVAVMAGFSQALYLVQDGRAGAHQLLHRARVLVIAGFTGEVNYEDTYMGGRMNPFTQVLVLAYVVLAMILLVNLLIAMMGNTYSEILQESEQRWVAERANIMATIENQCSAERNHCDRKEYAIPLRSRSGDEDLYLQIEVNDMANWKAQRSFGHDDDGDESDGG